MYSAEFSVSPTQSQIGAQNDAFTVSIQANATLRARLAAQAPLGVRVDVMDGGTLSRTGIVSALALGADRAIELDCESSGWTTPLPLRTNADMGIFRDVQTLPLRYGRAVPGRCVRLGSAGTHWLWADHASAGITSVTVDGQGYGAWQWRNDIDSNGNPITLVITSEPLEEGAELVAVGDGMLDSYGGHLIVNPADMAYDLCRRAAQPVDRGALVPFRSECLARNLEVSGSVDAGSLQSNMVTLSESVYAVFSRELPGLLRLLPRTGATVTIPARDTPTGTAEREGIATRLRVRFALEDDKPRASVEVRAVAVEAVRGIASQDLTLPLVRDARVATDVASRMLGNLSRVAYTVPSARQLRRIRPGEVVSATVTDLGISGEALVLSSRIEERGSVPTLSLRIGAVPTITVAAVAAAYIPEQYTTTSVVTVGNDRLITITDRNGQPIAGAECTLDGSLTRTSDGAGIVAFPVSLMPAGVHTIDVVAIGHDPTRLTVTIP